jgi:quinol monooxygenase YgiN
MHIQVVNFNLSNMTEAEFRAMCDEVAPMFAAAPGLVRKVWLADPAANTYGGVYTWRDREAYDAYVKSELFAAVAGNPHFTNIVSRDFGVLEAPTAVTRGLPQAAVA